MREGYYQSMDLAEQYSSNHGSVKFRQAMSSWTETQLIRPTGLELHHWESGIGWNWPLGSTSLCNNFHDKIWSESQNKIPNNQIGPILTQLCIPESTVSQIS